MLVGEGPIGRLLDIGTGTGRILELLAPHSEHSVGLDVDHDMLQLARAALGEAQLSRAAVRHGDLHRPPFEAGSFDVAVMHHVLAPARRPGRGDRRRRAAAAPRWTPAGRRLRQPRPRAAARRCTGTAGSGSPTRRCWAGRRRRGSRSRASARCRRSAPDEQLTVRLWLLRARRAHGAPDGGRR